MFEQAGYQGYAEDVKRLLGMFIIIDVKNKLTTHVEILKYFITLTMIVSADKPIDSHTDEGINADTVSSPINPQEVSFASENLSLAANVDRCTKKHPDDISGEDLYYTPPSSPTPLDGVR